MEKSGNINPARTLMSLTKDFAHMNVRKARKCPSCGGPLLVHSFKVRSRWVCATCARKEPIQ